MHGVYRRGQPYSSRTDRINCTACVLVSKATLTVRTQKVTPFPSPPRTHARHRTDRPAGVLHRHELFAGAQHHLVGGPGRQPGAASGFALHPGRAGRLGPAFLAVRRGGRFAGGGSAPAALGHRGRRNSLSAVAGTPAVGQPLTGRSRPGPAVPAARCARSRRRARSSPPAAGRAGCRRGAPPRPARRGRWPRPRRSSR